MTEPTIFSRPAWLAGCGNMGSALVMGWLSCGFDLTYLTVIRPSGGEIPGVRLVSSVEEAGSGPKYVILAMKPQQLAEAAAQLRPHLSSDTVIISVLAGVELATLRAFFPGVDAVVRAIPNLGVAIRRGVTALVGEGLDGMTERDVAQMFQPLGFAMWAADEDKLAVIGAIAGAGPAYVARFIAALTKAGEKMGLTTDIATSIAVETVFGTAWLAAANRESVEMIAKRVASPNGTTEAGLAVLDQNGALDALVAGAIEAAGRRGKELAIEAQAASLAADGALH